MKRLAVETGGTEEAEALNMEATLEMEVDGGEEVEGGETLMALGFIGLLKQEEEPVRTMLVDAHNGFNEISHLIILWIVWHRWPA